MKARILSVICLVGLIALVPAADAQRRSGGVFAGNWKGTLNMDLLYDVPAELVERLSNPVDLELRVFGRGNAELYFTSKDDVWNFTEQRDFRITLIGDNNAVIVARIPTEDRSWQNSFAFNLTKQGDDAVLLSWSRMTVRNRIENDGLDELAFAGTAQLQRID